MANKGYDPRNKVNFDAKVNDQGKTLRDEINEAFELFKENTTKTPDDVLREKMRGAVKDEMFNYILSIDKSAYAEITNNEAVSKTILFNFQYGDVFRKIQTKDQVNRLENIYTDHRNIKDRRNQLLARVQAGEHLTPEENEILTQKTPFEGYLDRATKNFFTEKIPFVESMISKTKNAVLYDRRCSSQEAMIKNLNNNLDGNRGAAAIKAGFKLYPKDVSPIFYDDEALKKYVKTLYQVRETHRTPNSKVAQLLRDGTTLDEVGDTWKTGARTFQYMDEYEAEEFFQRPADQISQYEADVENLKRFMKTREMQKANYDAALDNFHKIEKYVSEHPEVYDFMLSPEYRDMMKLEYRASKPLENIPPKERAAHLLNMYQNKHFSLIPREHREEFIAARNKMALQELGGANARLKEIEQKLGAYWKANANNPETKIQKQELKENRAILKALGDYLKTPSPKNQEKYFIEVNKAYDNAKQRYLDNPDLRERMEMRSMQLGLGDFSYVPIANARVAADLKIASYLDKRVYSSEEASRNAKAPRPFIEQAYTQYVRPVWRKAIDEVIKDEESKRPEYTLSQMAKDLKGKELEEYKESIYDRRMQQIEDAKVEFTVKMEELKEQKNALNKQYGVLSRMFDSKYKEAAKDINQKMEGIQKTYKAEQDKAKYDILKTYQEKGLKLSRSEANELKSLTKEAAKTGDLQKWDKERAEEKRKIEEYNKTFDGTEMEKPQETEKNVPTTTQLDLGARIHNRKTVEQPIKEETIKENTIAKEQKTPEEKDIEI